MIIVTKNTPVVKLVVLPKCIERKTRVNVCKYNTILLFKYIERISKLSENINSYRRSR